MHYQVRAREIFDVSGTGDALIATMGCTFAVGGTREDTMHLVNVAACIVFGGLGTVSATPEEILHQLEIEQA